MDTAAGTWDEVIVGGGTAGAVLAARLSADPTRRVLLVEAGPDPAGPDEPPNVLGMPVVSGYNWDYTAYVGADASGRQAPYPLGKVVGGTSAINGAIALRGLPRDFDGWAAAGNPEWAWDRVLPWYASVEADPVPIRRAGRDDLHPLSVAFLRACAQLGLPALPDLNAGPLVGAGPIPSNGRDRRRLSSADTHLAPARHRPNLTVWDRCHADRVVLDRGRATGLKVVRAGRSHRVAAGRVTLAAGGLGTPAVLQRSGIGPAARLAALGIRPVLDLPGVGANLVDHPAVPVWVLPAPGTCRAGDPWYQVMARAASSRGDPDLGIVLASNIVTAGLPGAQALGGRIAAMVSAVLLDPDSRGQVLVRGPDPDLRPTVVLALGSAARDARRLARAVRLVWSLVRAAPFAERVERVVGWTDRMVGDDGLLRAALARWTVPLFHAAGSARMGPPADTMAVVDQRCRVHQVDGLVVCDASVLPSQPSAPPSLTCVVLAERVAAWMS